MKDLMGQVVEYFNCLNQLMNVRSGQDASPLTATGQGLLSQSVDVTGAGGGSSLPAATGKQTNGPAGHSPSSINELRELGANVSGMRETFITANINSKSRQSSQMLLRNQERSLLEKANDALKRLEIALFRTF